jgi:hypothetical protein
MTIMVLDRWSSLPGYLGVQHTLTTICAARNGFVVLEAVKIIFGEIGGGVKKG